MLLVEGPSGFVEIRHAGKKVLGSCKDQLLDVLEQMTADTPLTGPYGHSQKLQIVAQQKLLLHDGDACHLAIKESDVAVSSLWSRTKDAVPIVLRVAEPFPGIGLAEQLDDGLTIIRIHVPDKRVSHGLGEYSSAVH